MALHRHVGSEGEPLRLDPVLSFADEPNRMPRLRIPEGTTPPQVAAQLVRSDLILKAPPPFSRPQGFHH